MAKKITTGLGRGLSALLNDISEASQEKKERASEDSPLVAIQEIDIKNIIPNPYQPRTEFAQDKIEELASSIKLMGVIQPITVKKLSDGKYQIISGERRFRASSLAGLATIPAYIRQADQASLLEMAIVENIQREDLDPIDIALSFRRLLDECSLTQEALSERVGKNRVTVTNFLRLLKLPPEIQLALKARKLSMGHAKAILGLEKEQDQLKLANRVVEAGLSVRQTEALVQKINEKAPSQKKEGKPGKLSAAESEVVSGLSGFFKKVVVKPSISKGTGSIVIRYASFEELQNFLKQLKERNL